MPARRARTASKTTSCADSCTAWSTDSAKRTASSGDCMAASRRGGHDNIAGLDASLTVRVYRQHGISIKYLGNRREVLYGNTGDLSQSRGTIGLFYVLLGHDRFGAVEWRKDRQDDHAAPR